MQHIIGENIPLSNWRVSKEDRILREIGRVFFMLPIRGSDDRPLMSLEHDTSSKLHSASLCCPCSCLRDVKENKQNNRWALVGMIYNDNVW